MAVSSLRTTLLGLTLVACSAASGTATDPAAAAAGASSTDPPTASTAVTEHAGVTGTVGAVETTRDAGADSSAEPPPPVACTTRTPGFFEDRTINVAGEMRRYDLFVPSGTDPMASLPMVFVFHADDGESLRSVLGLESVTGTKAIVVYPYGNGNAWSFAKPDRNDDYAFVDALKSAVASAQCANAARTFAYGFSNGGYFINQMACYRGTAAFRGIAVNSAGLFAPAGMPEEYDDDGNMLCPAPPPAALVIHGTSDGSVDYQSEGVFTMSSWRHANACATSSTAVAPSPCVTYSGCTPSPVSFCPISGMGHQVWSGAASASWAFFSTQL